MQATGEYKFYATAVLLFFTTQSNYYLNNTFIFFKDHLLHSISRFHELVLVFVVPASQVWMAVIFVLLILENSELSDL